MKRVCMLLLCLALGLSLAAAPLAFAAPEGEARVVRVGWFESSYNRLDASGRRSGYSYDYQIKIACYTGWSYEYVSGSWSELMEMLERGEIDLMSDVSYTDERAERMLFSSQTMGTEDYYVFCSPFDPDIRANDPTSLNGKRVGVNKNSIQAAFYRDWAERNGVSSELIEVVCSEEESLEMLDTGELDAYVTVDAFTGTTRAVPVCKVGSSDYYFAVSKERPELLVELDGAMNRILDGNRFYNQQLFETYMVRAGANAFLSAEEVDWLSNHGAIRVGYQDNYLAFCAADENGELTGVLRDYLAYASDCMANAHIRFEAIAYPTVAEATEALQNGELDCVFPVNLSDYDGEMRGLVMTPAITESEMYAVVSQTGQKSFAAKEQVIAAVNAGNLNYDAFLLDHFPDWQRVYYPTTQDCLRAVSKGEADCVVISGYRYNNIARLCERYRLVSLATGAEMDYSLAVGKGQPELYSILAKIVAHVPKSTVNSALSYYIAEDARLTFTDFIADHLGAAMSVVGLVVLVILLLLVQNMRAVSVARNLISATENDELTGLYNRSFFFQYVERMFREHPDTPRDALVLNMEQFHSVNELNGRDFGDKVLRALGEELRAVAEEYNGIAGRFEADHFEMYCQHTGAYHEILSRLQGTLDALAPNANLRLRMGVMSCQPKLEPVHQFDRARTACTMARGRHQERLVVFDEEIRKREIYEQRLLSGLRRALESDEFEVYYQPKFDIQTEPPRLVSAEALVRWRHPELGMIPPGDFIPLFENNGQIGLLDKHVWEQAAQQVAQWRDTYGVTVPVSVNLSRIDVFDPALEQTLDSILLRSGLSHSAMKLEVTESAYTENADQVIQVVESLRRKGYEVEMDDFGTGYSSLNMLSAMPVDVLKMDRGFIRNIEREEKDIQFVALILDIARNLKIPVVAEGVETEAQMKLLKRLGCAIVQGYVFSRPLRAADFEAAYLNPEKR